MISLVILAAGLSSRFGSNKLLYKIEGQPIIRRVATEALSSKADEVIVVLGHEAGRIRRALLGLRCKFALNRQYRTGQSSSVKAGLRTVKDNADAMIILPGDVAFVTHEVIDFVIGRYERFGSQVVVASHKGKFGHPILLDSSLFDEIMKIDESTSGLKVILDRFQDKVLAVEAGSSYVLVDIDTRDDLAKGSSL